ncbi:hypothetical protein BDV06DRAFT_38449 [Aspergillus oleicola]
MLLKGRLGLLQCLTLSFTYSTKTHRDNALIPADEPSSQLFMHAFAQSGLSEQKKSFRFNSQLSWSQSTGLSKRSLFAKDVLRPSTSNATLLLNSATELSNNGGQRGLRLPTRTTPGIHCGVSAALDPDSTVLGPSNSIGQEAFR